MTNDSRKRSYSNCTHLYNEHHHQHQLLLQKTKRSHSLLRYSRWVFTNTFSDSMLLVGRQEGRPACKEAECLFVGGSDFARLSAITTAISLLSSLSLSLSLRFNGHFPGEPGLAGVY